MNANQELDFCAHELAVRTEGWSAEQKTSEFRRRALRPSMIDRIITIQNKRAVRRTVCLEREAARRGDPIVYRFPGRTFESPRAISWKSYKVVWYVTMTKDKGKQKFNVICDYVDKPTLVGTTIGGVIVGRFLKRTNAVKRRDELKGWRLYAIAMRDIDQNGNPFGVTPLFVGTWHDCVSNWNFVSAHWGCTDIDMGILPISKVCNLTFDWPKEY